MRQPEKVHVEYVGFKNPGTLEELELELAGLKTAIAAAHSRISLLEQSRQLHKMGYTHDKTVEEGSQGDENKQKSESKTEQNSSVDEKES